MTTIATLITFIEHLHNEMLQMDIHCEYFVTYTYIFEQTPQ